MPISDLTGPVTSTGSATAIADGAIGIAKISGLGTLATLNAAPAGTLTGNTLAAGVTASSLTSVGTLAALTVTAPINGSVTGNAATVTTNANLTGPITSVGNATSVAAQTGTGSTFVMQASPTLTTPDIGVATATSINKVAITAPASSATLTIANGKTLTVSNSITLAGTDSTVMTFPATSQSIPGLSQDNTFSGRFINSVNGALSAPAGTFTGTWITGGTATTTKPMVLIEPAGSTSIAWSTSGTGLGINAASGFSGNFIDVQLNGSPRASLSYAGTLTIASTISAGASSFIGFSSRSYLSSPSDGTVLLSNAAISGFTRLQLGPDVAAPTAVIIDFGSVVAGTSNTAGAAGTITGSQGTGTGTGGAIIFQTAPAGGTGTSQNPLVTALTITGEGAVTVSASTTVRAGFILTQGVAPTTPTDGMIWQDGTDVKIRIGGVTKTFTLT